METEYNGLYSLPSEFLLLIPNCSYVLSERANLSENLNKEENEKGPKVRTWSRPLINSPVLMALNPALLFPVMVGVGAVLVLQNKKKNIERLLGSWRSYNLLLVMLFGVQAPILQLSWQTFSFLMDWGNILYLWANT